MLRLAANVNMESSRIRAKLSAVITCAGGPAFEGRQAARARYRFADPNRAAQRRAGRRESGCKDYEAQVSALVVRVASQGDGSARPGHGISI
jgi:hypothetical protein